MIIYAKNLFMCYYLLRKIRREHDTMHIYPTILVHADDFPPEIYCLAHNSFFLQIILHTVKICLFLFLPLQLIFFHWFSCSITFGLAFCRQLLAEFIFVFFFTVFFRFFQEGFSCFRVTCHSPSVSRLPVYVGMWGKK